MPLHHCTQGKHNLKCALTALPVVLSQRNYRHLINKVAYSHLRGGHYSKHARFDNFLQCYFFVSTPLHCFQLPCAEPDWGGMQGRLAFQLIILIHLINKYSVFKHGSSNQLKKISNTERLTAVSYGKLDAFVN